MHTNTAVRDTDSRDARRVSGDSDWSDSELQQYTLDIYRVSA